MHHPTPGSRGRTIGAIAIIGLIAAACSSAASPSPASSAPTAAATPATVTKGTFHMVDGDGSGSVALEHLADGSFAVVFEDFNTPSNTHIDVIVVAAKDVTRDQDVDPKAIVDLGPLTGTTGMQDYPFPTAMSANAMTYHTVVLWDTQMTHAIAAAPLGGG
jgi:hypothetical protein